MNFWNDKPQIITSMDLAKRDEILPSVRQADDWDLIIVDEAHRMSARDTEHKSERYRLGELLREKTAHFLLLTATPHKGDPTNFSLFLQLLDQEAYADVKSIHDAMDRWEAACYLRRTKEVMHEIKLSRLEAQLTEQGIFADPNLRLLIFTEYKDTLDYLVSKFRSWNLTVGLIHGSMKPGSRDEEETRLWAERNFWDLKTQVLVATEAAGEGINLQCCHVLFNYDIPWNPNRLEQRMGRIHRYGQTKDCLIFNFFAQNTVEGRVLQKLVEKLQEIRDALDDDAVFNKHLVAQDQGDPSAIGLAELEAQKLHELERRRDLRLTELARQRSLSLQGVERIGVAVAMPHPERNVPAHTHLKTDPETERKAVETIIAYEKARGCKIEDVQNQNLGFDLRSLDPLTGELRLIEAKGIGAATGTIFLSPNEKRIAEDRRDLYWLYIVTHCDTEPQLQEPIRDPARFPWHEVKKVEHYRLEVNAMTQPMQMREESPPYGADYLSK
ncbi:MAG TPA: helicase-related protein [Verrucomicrobiota bacterium]|nr:helicase-related protein [Verrucomicrobiota bacterium]OQC65038.1 MAG: DEAD-box ATP-dependent RNA helicase CshA [Verrucomicrobia bacterium ADurb.Bin006]HOA61883.1 helicase-related protein [Verrucomicrobiota bacterium]HOF49368.1 helicase-related protein [Verrucomicrobiota bacterium]HOR72502.1 helicase-related protein [Verrucomicrobiota bacterium]